MDYSTADTITVDLMDISTVDLMNISSTGQAWDPYFGAVPPVTITNLNGPSTTWAPTNGKIKLDGEAADIEINGRSLMQILDGLEQKLGLLKCREDLESDWSELKALGDQYRAMVKSIEQKSKMWNTLKA